MKNLLVINPYLCMQLQKKELIANSYFNIYGLILYPRFTVYGPYGRPDMSLFKFTKSIFENKTIELYNNGNQEIYIRL